MRPQRASEPDLQPGGYYNERLDDVNTRLARIEGRMESLATREEVANAKFNLLAYWVGLGLAIIIGAVNISIVLFRVLGDK